MPKRRKNRKTEKFMKARVFGYGGPTGCSKRWRTICKRAGNPYLSAHRAGRHGFFTELVVRQGIDSVTAAKAGRWSDLNLPMKIYAHSETDEADVRALFRTLTVLSDRTIHPKVWKTTELVAMKYSLLRGRRCLKERRQSWSPKTRLRL